MAVIVSKETRSKNLHKRHGIAIFVLTAGLALASGVARATTLDTASVRCAALTDADFSGVIDAHVRVKHTVLVARRGEIPTFCQAEGHITALVEVQIRLPVYDWNGKFLAIANALSGDECNSYLARGYACMPMFRTFKKGMRDEDWAALLINDPAARLEMNRASHLLTLAGKGIVDRYYSRSPRRSYFMGCSGGGYYAMVQAQTFPWDYDGIVAGAPSLDVADWAIRAAWMTRSSMDDHGRPILNDGDLRNLHRAALDECDLDDGLADGIISNPMQCRFDPTKLLCNASKPTGCLTAQKVAAVKRIYAGPGHAIADQLPGSELEWNVTQSSPAQLQFLAATFGYMFYGASPEVTPMNFDFDKDMVRMGLETSMISTATNPDLRRFKNARAKLIAYLGTSDPTHATGIIDYYETVEKTMGGPAATMDFFRFFLVPAMGHCRGGSGPYAIDYLGYLEAWVERNQAPDFMIGAHPSDGLNVTRFPLDPNAPIAFTRPVYPFPRYARYRGDGDPDDAASFQAIDPRSATE